MQVLLRAVLVDALHAALEHRRSRHGADDVAAHGVHAAEAEEPGKADRGQAEWKEPAVGAGTGLTRGSCRIHIVGSE